MVDSLLVPKVGPALPVERNTGVGADQRASRANFAQALGGELAKGDGPSALPPSAITSGKLKFSAHALDRIRERGLAVDSREMARLEAAIDKAAAKGARDTLVISNDSAYIVSVKNKTVVTALDKNLLNNNVFTNIDSTVVLTGGGDA